MAEENNVYKALDKVLDLQHRIVNFMVRMARTEVEGKKVREIEEGLLVKEFERLRAAYSEVREAANDYKVAAYHDKINMYGHTAPVMDEVSESDAKRDDNLIVDIRDLMNNYIEEAYTDMQYRSDDEVEVVSIYEGTEEEHIRLLEFEAYKENITALEHQDMFEELDLSTILPFQVRLTIIDDVAERECYYKSYERMCRLLDGLDSDPGKFSLLTDEERKRLRTNIVFRKYEEKFLYMNQYYNGVLAPELPITPMVVDACKNSGLHTFLGIPESELSSIYNPIVKEYLEGINTELKDELVKVTAARRIPKKEEKRLKIKKVMVKKAEMLKAGIKPKDKKKRTSSKKKTDSRSNTDNRIIKITVIKRKDGKIPGEDEDAR